jgi:hypothetical protein
MSISISHPLIVIMGVIHSFNAKQTFYGTPDRGWGMNDL